MHHNSRAALLPAGRDAAVDFFSASRCASAEVYGRALGPQLAPIARRKGAPGPFPRARPIGARAPIAARQLALAIAIAGVRRAARVEVRVERVQLELQLQLRV